MILKMQFVQDFIRIANDGWLQGWHERNGGNLSYHIKEKEIAAIENQLSPAEWQPIMASVPDLAGEYFLVTGSGKYFSNVARNPEDALSIIEIDKTGKNFRICWGMKNGGRPTSELPTHLLTHQLKFSPEQGGHRVVYHAHPANTVALTFVLPLDDASFTREIWEMETECPIVFPRGLGIVPWMVPGGEAIGLASVEKLKIRDAVIWAHHGMFCSGKDFDETFGLMHTIEKAAEILVKVRSMGGRKLNTIHTQDFRQLAKDFHVELMEEFLNIEQ